MNKLWFIKIAAVFFLSIEGLTACNSMKVVKISTVEKYEAENATIRGKYELSTDRLNASGGIYVVALAEDGDRVDINVRVSDRGYYDLVFQAAGIGGKKESTVYVDNCCEGTLTTPASEGFAESVLKRVYLAKGRHTITLKKDWGSIALDYLILRKADLMNTENFHVEAQLADKEADKSTVALMSYLCSIYGEKTLSGQYCLTGPEGSEMAIISQVTGRQPAILGLDMRDYSLSAIKYGAKPQVVQWASDYWEKGGIILLSWHWFVPEKYTVGEWWEAYYANETTIDLNAILNGTDPEGYELLMNDLDSVASALRELQQMGIPVLWRPLHEGSGGWFWWGTGGSKCYKQLWRLMFDKFTVEYGLHNLIWVYSGMDREWYPGDEYVDIIGEDIYSGKHCYSAQGDKFLNALDYTETKKLIMLSEMSTLPDPDNLSRDDIYWLGCVLWGEKYLMDESGSGRFSGAYIRKNMLQKYYQHEQVITLDELPDFTEYFVK